MRSVSKFMEKIHLWMIRSDVRIAGSRPSVWPGFSRITTTLLFVALAIPATGVFGQQAPPPEQAPPALPSLAGVKVEGVKNLKTSQNIAGLNDTIEVTVTDLKNLVQFGKCRSLDDKPVSPCNTQNITLFLQGRELRGVIPDAFSLTDGTLQFGLTRNKDAIPDKGNDKIWADLLGAPSQIPSFFKLEMNLSVGFANGSPVPSSAKLDLIRIHKIWFWICLVLLLVVIILLACLSWYSEILRDQGPTPPNNAGGVVHKPYSIARCQMAFWFTLVVVSFVFIWLITGASDTITASVLALIGIGSGTALGAALVDSGKRQQEPKTSAELELEKQTLETDIETVKEKIAAAGATPDPALTQEMDLKEKRLTEIENSLRLREPRKSEGFINDILTDETGRMAFHRFQMFVWTLILGILFVYGVWEKLSMPDFDATLLALMGISNGVYLGFKLPENQ